MKTNKTQSKLKRESEQCMHGYFAGTSCYHCKELDKVLGKPAGRAQADKLRTDLSLAQHKIERLEHALRAVLAESSVTLGVRLDLSSMKVP